MKKTDNEKRAKASTKALTQPPNHKEERQLAFPFNHSASLPSKDGCVDSASGPSRAGNAPAPVMPIPPSNKFRVLLEKAEQVTNSRVKSILFCNEVVYERTAQPSSMASEQCEPETAWQLALIFTQRHLNMHALLRETFGRNANDPGAKERSLKCTPARSRKPLRNSTQSLNALA